MLGQFARALLVPTLGLVAYFVVPLEGRNWPFAIVLGLGLAAAVVPLARRRIARISSSDQPVLDAVAAVALVAVLVVIGFSLAHYAIGTQTDQFPAIETRIDALYFTVTTISTVGYGDLVPVGQGARALVTVQIIVNLTLLAVAIRLLLGTARDRMAERKQA